MKRWNYNSLSTKINGLFVTSIVGISLALTSILLPYMNLKIKDETELQYSIIANSQFKAIQEYIQSAQEELGMISKSVAETDPKQIPTVLSDLRGTNSKFLNVYYIDGKGKELAKMGYDTTLKNRKNDPAFQETIKNGSYVGTIQKDATTGKYEIELAVAVKNYINQPIGVVGVKLDAENIWRDTRSNDNTTNQIFYLVSKKGDVLASDDSTMLSRNKNQKNNIVQSFLTEVKTHHSSSFTQVGEETDRNQEKQIIAYTYSKEYGMATFVQIPTAKAMSMLTSMTQVIVIIMVVSILIIAYIGLIFSRSFIRPIQKLMELAEKVSKGDLRQTTEIRRKDEIGILAYSFDEMVNNLRKIIVQTKGTSDLTFSATKELDKHANEVASTSEQVFQAIDEIAKGAEYQTILNQEIDGSVDNFMTVVEKINTQSEEVVKNANETQEVIERSQKSIEGLIEGVESLSRSAQLSSAEVGKLEGKANEIGTIIETLNNIASHTHLLALNASIEAARAGEQGRGFAVVADEVKKLAEQSQNSSKKVESIIQEVLGNITILSKKMAESITDATEKRETAQKAKEDLSSIIGSVQEVIVSMKEMNEYLSEQGKSIEKIKHDSKSASAVSVETSANAEEVAASAVHVNENVKRMYNKMEQLTKIAEELKESVDRFTIE